jgi:cell division protein FtsB
MMGRETPEPDSGLRRKAVTLSSLLAIIALVVGSLFGDSGILQLMQVREQASALQSEIDVLDSENSGLVRQILELRSDPRSIERLARERLGLAAPGETVFLLRPPESPRP